MVVEFTSTVIYYLHAPTSNDVCLGSQCLQEKATASHEQDKTDILFTIAD
jgi:hypothetical protein